jgi:uncharacterized protein YegJ (DUF2314 family)
MNEGKTLHPDRDIIYRLAVAEFSPYVSGILVEKNLVHPDANGFVGFFYVDHDEGISLRIYALCRTGPGRLPEILVTFEDHGEDLVLRYDEIVAYDLLSNEDAARLSLLEEQRWFTYFETEQLHEVRNRTDLDKFRATGFFDDVSVVLMSDDGETIPEVVWVRLERQSEDGNSFYGILLNEPDADFGVHEGDALTVVLHDGEDGRFLVAGAGAVETGSAARSPDQ